MDSITYLRQDKTYRVPEGREAFTSYFCEAFPHEVTAIRAYVNALYDLAEEVDMFWLRRGRNYLFTHSEQFLWSADELISYYIKDRKLQDVLAYMSPMYGGVKGHTPAYIHALINVLYINGSSRFVGGSQQLADALTEVIRSHGGEVMTGAEVTALHVNDHRVERIDFRWDDKGEEIQTLSVGSADVISAIHPATLIPMCTEGSFPKAYRQRIAQIPNTYSAFTLYILFKENSFPYINHTCYAQEDYGMIWNIGEYEEESWPHGWMYMTPPDPDTPEASPSFSRKMIINCLMPFSVVEPWIHTTVGHRGETYRTWKEKHIQKILDKMERLYPGFRGKIEYVEASSPLTIRDYYHQPEGALYGVRKDCRNMMLSQIPIYTKVRNLFLTGQNINLHGICGVPLTAINTAEAIVGENTIIDKLNEI
jgi:all-trans-retinol 13,14-reductase